MRERTLMEFRRGDFYAKISRTDYPVDHEWEVAVCYTIIVTGEGMEEEETIYRDANAFAEWHKRKNSIQTPE